MLTDAELNQMAADAAEMQRLRDAATPGPWLRDLERPRTILCVQLGLVGGVLYNTNGGPDADFIAAARSDNSAEHVERLVQEVRRLKRMLIEKRAVYCPQSMLAFNAEQFAFCYDVDDETKWNAAKECIEACHIHGVPVPEHLKPYEENVNG